MSPRDQALTPAEIQQRLRDLPGWAGEGSAIQRTWKTDGWPMTLMAVNAIGFLCESGFHHPDLMVSWGQVTVRLWTHTAGGVTPKDFEMARRIDAVLAWRPGPGEALTGPPKPLVKDG